MSMDLPVSVVLTCYNQRRYIAESIDSVLSQSAPLELVVVDDGSSDGTREEIDRFTDPRLKRVYKANGGPSSAVNAGVAASSGEVLVLMSGDDALTPESIAIRLEVMAETGADIVGGIPELIDGQGRVLDLKASRLPFRRFESEEPAEVFRTLFYEGNSICAPSVALTRAVWDRTGPFHHGLLQLQDYDYWLRATALGHRLTILDHPFVRYRMHPENLSSSRNDARVAFEHLHVMRGCAALLSRFDLAWFAFDLAAEHLAGGTAAEHLLPHAYLRHSNPAVRRIGLELLTDLLDREADRSLVEDRFGVSAATLFAATAAGAESPP